MIQKKTTRRLGVIALALLALAMAAAPASGAIYNLAAVPAQWTPPAGGTPIPMWGFIDATTCPDPATPGSWATGPELVVPSADTTLTVNLLNCLPVGASIMIPGQAMPQVGGVASTVARTGDGRVRSFVSETPPAATASYQWTNLKPGTYLYHSGTHPAVQVQMGLYGAVTKNEVDSTATTPAEAYPDKTYDAYAVLIYSEIDPAVHAAAAADPAGYSATMDYDPKYFLVNGEADDPAAPIAMVAPSQTVLIRLLNAGLKAHAPEILGAHLKVIAEDGNLYPYPRQHSSLLLAAGKTLDALLEAPVPGNYPIFDRRLYRANDPTVQGTMHAYISAEAAP